MSIESIKENPAIMGGSKPHQGERPRERTHKRHRPHRGNEERMPGGSRGQRERDTPAPEGVQLCLSGVQRRGHGSYNDEYLSEGAHSTPTTRETWCRGKDPHTGPMAFNAMRHNEEEKSMHNTHSKHGGKATRPSPGATKPRGRDQ